MRAVYRDWSVATGKARKSLEDLNPWLGEINKRTGDKRKELFAAPIKERNGYPVLNPEMGRLEAMVYLIGRKTSDKPVTGYAQQVSGIMDQMVKGQIFVDPLELLQAVYQGESLARFR